MDDQNWEDYLMRLRLRLKLNKTAVLVSWLILGITLPGSPNNWTIKTMTVESNHSYGGILNEGCQGNVTAINPVLSSYANYDSPNGKIERLLFEPLVTFDKNLGILPHLAQRWESTPDKKSYTFHLRNDVFWHDGEKFTADDVIFTWDRLLDPSTQHKSYTTVKYYTGLLDTTQLPYEKLDNYTVRFILAGHYPGYDFLSRCVFPILPEHVYTNHLGPDGLPHTEDDCRTSNGTYTFNTDPINTGGTGTPPIGTGSLMFGSWHLGENITLVRNSRENGGPGYWQEHNAYLDQYVLHIISYGPYPTDLLTSGQLDLFRHKAPYYDPEVSHIRAFRTNKSFSVLKSPRFRYEFLGFQCDPSKGNLYGKRERNFQAYPNYLAGFAWQAKQHPRLTITGHLVRPALNYAVNKTQVMAAAYPFGYRQLGPVFKAYPQWYSDNLHPYSYNLERANELLGQAGFGDSATDPRRQNLNITLTAISGLSKPLIANITAQLQQNLGISVVSEHIQFSEGYTYLDEQVFDALAYSKSKFTVSQTPNLLRDWHSKYIQPGGRPTGVSATGEWEWSWSVPSPEKYGPNIVSYWNPQVDQLLEIAQTESNQQVLQDYYTDIQRLIVQDCPAIFLFSRSEVVVLNASFHGFVKDSPQGLWPEPVGFHNIYLYTTSTDSPRAVPPNFLSFIELTVIFIGLSGLGLLGYLLYIVSSRGWKRKHPVKTYIESKHK